MEEALLKVLKVDQIKSLSKEERRQVLLFLKENHGYTNRSLGKVLNLPHSTIHDWCNLERNDRGYLKIGIKTIIDRLKEFEPSNLREVNYLKQLKKIVDDKVKNNKFERDFNKIIGWKDENE